MRNRADTNLRRQRLLAAVLLLGLILTPLAWAGAQPAPPAEVIVQGGDLAQLAELVESAGGTVLAELGLISAISARVPADSIASLQAQPAVQRVWPNAAVVASDGGADDDVPDTAYPRVVGAPAAWAQGVTGQGVGVAIIDTGAAARLPGLARDTQRAGRIVAYYDAIHDRVLSDPRQYPVDTYGHGTHVAGIIANSQLVSRRAYAGIAPDARLILVRALGPDGSGSYADVIRGLDWVVANRARYNIRVVNLSLSAPVRSYYWDDPLNQAVMRAWASGLVVVAAAGNGGPAPMTIGVPANVPYVISVGAFTDRSTPDDPSDDYLPAFSAAGPTVEGFVKPELVAPGGHLLSTMLDSSTLASDYLESEPTESYHEVTGTSMAAAATTGVVALMLQQDPGLTPDMVKYRLMASADPAVNAAGGLAYSLFQQGAGRLDAAQAVLSPPVGTANQGLDLGADLAGERHFGGRANRGPDGVYYITDVGGYTWSGGHPGTLGYTWSGGYTWSAGYTWSTGLAWNAGYAWSTAYTWSTGYAWSAASAVVRPWPLPE